MTTPGRGKSITRGCIPATAANDNPSRAILISRTVVSRGVFFEQRLIGAMRNFGYVIGDPATKVAAVIDPSFDARVLQKAASENGYAITLIFNTHHHPDHIYDNGRLANETGAKVAAHRLSNVAKDVILEDGQIVGVGELKVKVVHTPGHSPDSCCYIVAGREVRDDGLGFRLRLAFPRRLLRATLRSPATLPVLRGTFHVEAQDPWGPSAGDHLDDGVSARVASVFRRHDEPALRERVGVIAFRIARAADEPLAVGPVPDAEFPVAALLAPTDEVLLPNGRTIGGDAVRRRAPSVRVLDHRGAALRTVLLGALDGPHLRERMRIPTRRVSIAPEEARPAAGADDRQVPLLAEVTLADVVLLPECGFDLLTDRLPVRLEGLEDLAEHLLGLSDDVLPRADARRDPFHVRLEVGRHLGLGDALRMIL